MLEIFYQYVVASAVFIAVVCRGRGIRTGYVQSKQTIQESWLGLGLLSGWY